MRRFRWEMPQRNETFSIPNKPQAQTRNQEALLLIVDTFLLSFEVFKGLNGFASWGERF